MGVPPPAVEHLGRGDGVRVRPPVVVREEDPGPYELRGTPSRWARSISRSTCLSSALFARCWAGLSPKQCRTVCPFCVRVSRQSIRPKVSTRIPRAPESPVPVTTTISPRTTSAPPPRRSESPASRRPPAPPPRPAGLAPPLVRPSPPTGPPFVRPAPPVPPAPASMPRRPRIRPSGPAPGPVPAAGPVRPPPRARPHPRPRAAPGTGVVPATPQGRHLREGDAAPEGRTRSFAIGRPIRSPCHRPACHPGRPRRPSRACRR